MKDTSVFEQYPEKALIERILKEPALYEILIRRNNAALYKTGRAYGYGHEDTQDLMQETFISAYLTLDKFESRSSFKTWLIRIMLNNCYHKKQKFSFKNEVFAEVNENASPMFADQQDTTDRVMNKELNAVIEKALLHVPIDYRMVFSMREMNGLNVAETAEALNISPANVKVRLNRAKAMLRKEVEKWYTTEDIYEFNLIYCDAMVNRVIAAINTLHK